MTSIIHPSIILVGFNLLNFMKIFTHPKEMRAEQSPKICENFKLLNF